MLKWPLLPFALIYGAGTALRNMFFNVGILPSKQYKIPVIGIGNLSTGGTGKSPHTIYVVNLLKDKFKTAVVSRGYGRQTKGFQMANYDTNYRDIGDEAMQIFERFRNKNIVAVCEKRTTAIDLVMEKYDVNCVVLDDSFQHRFINPGLKILLTAYDDIYPNNFLLPVGNLREGKRNAKRADIIIVTKSPENISLEKKKEIIKKIKPHKGQTVFFSSIIYSDKVKNRNTEMNLSELEDYHVILVTGIANADPMVQFLNNKVQSLQHLIYKDHHNYTDKDIETIENKYQEVKGNKIILTTEKDYMRLQLYNSLEDDLFFLPIETQIDNAPLFEQKILEYAQSN